MKDKIIGTESARKVVDRRLVVAGIAGVFGAAAMARVPRVAAQPECPKEGPQVEGCPVGEGVNLIARSQFSRFYFINSDSQARYSHGDRDVQGVPNARLLVESLKHIGSTDFVQIPLASRRIAKVDGRDTVIYLDKKNNLERHVEASKILYVPADGGVGLALDKANGNTPVLEWRRKPGENVDMTYGPIAAEARENKDHDCGGACGFNCVQWIVVHRLTEKAQVVDGQIVPNDVLHRDQQTGRISGFNDYIYFWDVNQGEVVRTEHQYINTPVVEGSDLWKKENLTFKSVVRPRLINPYTYYE
jgi:hypothetical protein